MKNSTIIAIWIVISSANMIIMAFYTDRTNARLVALEQQISVLEDGDVLCSQCKRIVR